MPTMEQTFPFERSYWGIPGKLMAGEYLAAANEAEAKRKLKGLIQAGIITVINLTEANEQNCNGKNAFCQPDS